MSHATFLPKIQVGHPTVSYHIQHSLIGKQDGEFGFLHVYLPGRHHTFKIKETTFYGHEMRTDPYEMGALVAPTNCGYNSPHDSTCLAHYLLAGLKILRIFIQLLFDVFLK